MTDANLERRRLLRGVAAAGAAVPLIAACGGEDPEKGATKTEPGSGKGEQTPEKTDESAPEETPSGGSGETLGAAAEIPVGGGKIFKAQKVVVTQPEEGVYKAFSAICTHNKCVLGKVEDKRIKCGCHRSEFDFTTGEPVQGPNGKPPSVISALGTKKVAVEGGNITVT